MATVIIFSLLLQALLYATCLGEPCSEDWKTETTAYRIVNHKGNLYIIVSCINKNFKVEGQNIVTCTNGEIPTYMPKCVLSEASCTRLKAPPYGSMMCSSTAPEVGSWCAFECQRTHYLNGSSSRVCAEDRRWSGSLADCIPKAGFCPRLKAPAHGSMKCSRKDPEVGSLCTFECQSTHYLRGSSKRTCSQVFRWTGTEAYCVIKPECQGPPPLSQGTIIDCSPYRKVKYNDKCNFTCNEGFQLKGPSYLTCRLNGKLSDEKGNEIFPRCRPTFPVDAVTRAPHSNGGPRNKPDPVSLVSCERHNGYCSHHCHQEPEGIRCSCRSGYKLARNGRTCMDVDECSDENLNKCDHLCRNTGGGYKCLCRNGYSSPDGFRCEETLTVTSDEDTALPFYPRDCGNGYRRSFDGRSCIDVDECADENLNKCDHLCRNTAGGYKCLCRNGYSSPDGFRCEDVNECTNGNLNKCDQTCVNTLGGYICSCRAGFVSPDGFKCEGCRVNSYRMISDASCRDCPANSHTEGDEKTSLNDCICNLGFAGNPAQRISCKDIDECADGKNFECSHICINTPGSAHCACPLGYQLKEDQKTCIDVDECSIKNGGCDGICHNTIGNFTCSCSEGYVASPVDRYRCYDIDECAEGNGGCSELCVNFNGGFHCSCSEGYHLHPDGKTCISVFCPRVYVPHHSTIRCKNSTTSDKAIFHPGKMPDDQEFQVGATCRVKCDKGYDIRDSHPTIVCQNDGKWNASLPECEVLKCPPLVPPSNGDVYPPSCKEGSASVKQKCVFTCHSGYRIAGQEVLTCRNNLTWKKTKPTKCVPETEVSISCPEDDITIELMHDEGWADIQLNSPRTTLAAGPIRVHPPWVSLDGPSPFPAGETEVTFSVTDANKTAECSISVIVLDKHPPVFSNCPETLFVTSGIAGTSVNWEEPVAIDNVGIASVTKSLEPNSTLSPGLHFVEYIARDFAGNIAQCMFHINVTASGCDDLADPENGEANCLEWMFGKICQPTCFENFTRPPELFACDDSGAWTPSNFISPCLPECFQDETWSPVLKKCVQFLS